MPNQLYRLKSNHKIIVRVIGNGFFRAGAKVKFRTVSYVDRDGSLDTRSENEFELMFERCK